MSKIYFQLPIRLLLPVILVLPVVRLSVFTLSSSTIFPISFSYNFPLPYFSPSPPLKLLVAPLRSFSFFFPSYLLIWCCCKLDLLAVLSSLATFFQLSSFLVCSKIFLSSYVTICFLPLIYLPLSIYSFWFFPRFYL